MSDITSGRNDAGSPTHDFRAAADPVTQAAVSLSSESESVIRSVTIGPQTRAEETHTKLPRTGTQDSAATSTPETSLDPADPERALVPDDAVPDREADAIGDRKTDELLAVLGHELRNPLAAMQNAIMAARLDPSCIDQALEIALRQGERLATAIEGILDVAREHGDFRIRWEAMKLDEVVDRALEAARPAIEPWSDTIVRSRAPELSIHGDATRLTQIVWHLLITSTRRATPGSTIEVITEKVGDRAVVRVRSTAPDLTAAMGSSATPSRSTSSVHRGLPAPDIGLGTAYRLAELHGGGIEDVTDAGEIGDELRVWLPVRHDESRATASGVLARRVLVVEDNRDSAQALTLLLEGMGHQVRVAYDGLLALQMLKTWHPEIALLDIGLPIIDGYELARRFRAAKSGRSVLLIALSGFGRDEDRERALTSGFDHHVTKPIDFAALERLMSLPAA
jgi:CheY-like chemotaxis protein